MKTCRTEQTDRDKTDKIYKITPKNMSTYAAYLRTLTCTYKYESFVTNAIKKTLRYDK